VYFVLPGTHLYHQSKSASNAVLESTNRRMMQQLLSVKYVKVEVILRIQVHRTAIYVQSIHIWTIQALKYLYIYHKRRARHARMEKYLTQDHASAKVVLQVVTLQQTAVSIALLDISQRLQQQQSAKHVQEDMRRHLTRVSSVYHVSLEGLIIKQDSQLVLHVL